MDLPMESHADEHSGQGPSKQRRLSHSAEAAIYVLLEFACMGSFGTGGTLYSHP